MNTTSLLSHACFAPVEYFVELLYRPVIIEKHSNYLRQTYRNRFQIMGANGPLSLSIPVEKSRGQKLMDKDVRIAYHTPWQNNHWQSLISAYNSSPFFQFYRDDIESFFTRKYKFLFDFNLEATEVISELLEIDTRISFTSEYIHEPYNEIVDLRESIHPKKNNINPTGLFKPVKYKQVFDERHGFIPNLSILDLLFNKGPEAYLMLEQSRK